MTMKRCISTGFLDQCLYANSNNALEDLLKAYDYDYDYDDDDSTYDSEGEDEEDDLLYTVSEDKINNDDCSNSGSTDEITSDSEDDSDDDYSDDDDTDDDSSCSSFLEEDAIAPGAHNATMDVTSSPRKGKEDDHVNSKVKIMNKRKQSILSQSSAAALLEQRKQRRGTSSGLMESTRSLLLRTSISAQEFASFGKGSIVQAGPATVSQKQKDAEQDDLQKPQDELMSLLQKHGYHNIQCVSNKSVPEGFFVQVTPSMIASYDMTIATAIRQGDLDTVRNLHQFEHKEMQACNKFHESIVHIAARRGHTETLAYLMDYAAVRVQVRCDSGRTPLHDACWTGSPNFECVELLLRACPDLILVEDNRGFTPLAYVPRDAWAQWNAFLQKNPHLVLPKVLASRG